jgi:hypothetical protein
MSHDTDLVDEPDWDDDERPADPEEEDAAEDAYEAAQLGWTREETTE